MASVMLTGGAGYIGSHTAIALAARGHRVVLLDSFANAERDMPERVGKLAGQAMAVIAADVRDEAAMAAAFAAQPVDAVIHFAALKAVGESEADPLLYYDVNVVGTIRLLSAMQRAGVGRIVFSSSATVYGQPDQSPIPEDAPLRVANIYGRTKLVMEQLIADLARTRTLQAAANLRYFNPVGAHESGAIGENPRGVPNNLMPYICQVAARQRAHLNVFGNDYDTPDGTGVRDYIHVMDLAEAHAAALDHVLAQDGAITLNLGTGVGFSVLDMIRTFEAATGRDVPYVLAPRRAGDVASYYADPTAANRLLGWKTTRDLAAMCRDAWRWQARLAGINDVR